MPRRLDQLRHDQRRNLRALVPEQHRALVEIVDGLEGGAAPDNDAGEIARDFFQPRLAVNLGELDGVLLKVQLERILGGHDDLNRARRGHARGGADVLANRAEHAREVHKPLAGEHGAGDAHGTRVRRVDAGLELVEMSPVFAQTRAARRAGREHVIAHRTECVELGRELRRRRGELREIPGGFVVSRGGIGHALRGELRLVHGNRVALGLVDDHALVQRHRGRQRFRRTHQRLVLHE